MADEKEKEEITEMVPQHEIEGAFPEETPLPSREVSDTRTYLRPKEESESASLAAPEEAAGGLFLGSLRDRIAASLIDLLALGYLYWGTFFIYNAIGWHEFLRPFHTQGKHAILFHAVYLFLCFLYFFVSEGVFFTTPGKFFCRLSVRNKKGEPASLLAITVRTLLRPLDYILSFLPTWMLLEKTPWRQRLGDLLSGTVVMKQPAKATPRLAVGGKIASGSARAVIALLDLALLAGWLAGFGLWIDFKRPEYSFLIVLLAPVIYLIWNIVWDGFFHCTLGQWIFGCRLVSEEGAPPAFSQAFLRALLKPIDLFFLLNVFASNRNQSGSDLAAGTVVIHAKRSWGHLIAVAVGLAMVGAVWFVGAANPRNFLSPSFQIDFLPKVFEIKTGGGVPLALRQKGIFLKRFSFLEEDRMIPRDSAEFKPGETVYFSFDVSGFAIRNSEAWVEEDLIVRYPNTEIGFKQESMVNFHQKLKNPEMPLEIQNTLGLPPNAQPGFYTLVIVLHDRFSDHHLTEQRTFRVLPP